MPRTVTRAADASHLADCTTGALALAHRDGAVDVTFDGLSCTGAAQVKSPSQPTPRRALPFSFDEPAHFVHTRETWKPEGIDAVLRAMWRHIELVEDLMLDRRQPVHGG
jgi:hypothetical protein